MQNIILNDIIIAGLPADVNQNQILSNILSKNEANCTINVQNIQNPDIIRSKMRLSSGNNEHFLSVKFKTIDSKFEFMNKNYENRSLMCSKIRLNTL